MNHTPTAITADRYKSELTIVWDDATNAIYPFALLRNACPCAECRGGHENMRPDPTPDMFIIPVMDARATQMTTIEAVGNYAITIEWADGHHYGIYNWDFLYALWKGMQPS